MGNSSHGSRSAKRVEHAEAVERPELDVGRGEGEGHVALLAEAPREVGVQQAGARHRQHRVRRLLRLRQHLQRRSRARARRWRAYGSRGAHHRVAADDADGHAPGVGGHAEVGGLGLHLRPVRLQVVVDLPDQHRVARGADRDGAVAGELHAFELDRVGLGRRPAHAADPHRAVRHAARTRQSAVSSRPPGSTWWIGAGVLVQGEVGDGERRAAADRVRRLADDAVLMHRHQQAVRLLRRGRLGAAFEHLAGVPGRRRRQPGAQGRRRPLRRVAAAPGEHHLRAAVERPRDGLRPHHGDDARGAVDRRGVERRQLRQRLGVAGLDAPGEVRLVRLGVDQRHAEAEPLLARDLAHQRRGVLEVRLAAGAARTCRRCRGCAPRPPPAASAAGRASPRGASRRTCPRPGSTAPDRCCRRRSRSPAVRAPSRGGATPRRSRSRGCRWWTAW